MTQSVAMPVNLSGTLFEGLAGTTGAAGVPAGLPGLFSGLVENAGPGAAVSNGFFTGLEASVVPPAADLGALLGAVPATADAGADPLAALQALLAQAGLQISNTLPADGVKIEGAAPAPADPLQALADALQQVQQKLSAAGIQPQSLATHDGLVKALQTLGVPAEKVEGMADTIEGALDQLKKKLAAGGDGGGDQAGIQMGALAQVLVAASVMPQLQDAAGKPLLADKQSLTFTISHAKAAATADVAGDASDALYAQANDALKFAAGLPAAGSMAREVAGLKEGTKADDAPVADTAPVTPQAVTDGTLPAVAITIDPVGLTVNSVQKTENPATPVVAAPKAIQTMQSVAAADVAKPADGEARFVWKGEDAAQPVAADTAKAKADTTKSEVAADMQVNRHAAETLQNNANATATTAADSDFAKQVEQYQQKLETAKRYDVTSQTVVQIKNLIDEGGGEVRIRLNPPELGQIHVDLVVKDGTVTGKISATDPAVVNALASDVKQFGEGLKQSGFKLGNDGLTFMLSQNPNQGQQQGQQQQFAQGQQGAGSAGWHDDTVLNDEPAAAQVSAWVSPDRLIDVNI